MHTTTKKRPQVAFTDTPDNRPADAGNKRNVLVVDDDDIVHMLTERLLSTFRCIQTVYNAYNGRQALDILQEGCLGLKSIPAVVLLDLHMPIMNGIDFLKGARQMECLRNERIVTIMISSTHDRKDIDEAADLGVDYFFSKPIGIEKLETVFRKEFPML